MKKILMLAVIARVAMMVGTANAQTPATITDLSGATPTPGLNDVYLLDTSHETGGNPPGLNYYIDNGSPPGQTFTTGSNPSGYLLTTLALLTGGGGSGSGIATAQPYYLRIYSVNAATTNSTLIATYISQTNFTFSEGDWLQWSNISVGLQPNTQYAWSFQRGTSGWELLASETGDEYTGGQVVLIPTGGGTMTVSTSAGYDANMDVGLQSITSLVVDSPTFSPANTATNGTAVTASVVALGSGTLSYQWQTDGGNGGTLTNIPGANSSTLSINTTGLQVGTYQYDVIVTNSSPVTNITSALVNLTIYNPSISSAALVDEGDSVLSGPFDISQLIGGGGTSANYYDGLNYYDNNNTPAGQTFTTGTNSQGYYLTSVALQTGGPGGSSKTTVAQYYSLYIYSVIGSNAALIATFTNASFSFTFGDWLEWSNFSVLLSPNHTYAYTFENQGGGGGSGTYGWAALSASPTNNPYSGGQICSIPVNGGQISFGQSGKADAVFDAGLSAIGSSSSPYPFANPISVSPSRTVAVGTQLTLNEIALGQAPLHYKWQTDGGSGGSLTTIPSTDTSNLVVNTTGFQPGTTYQYDVIVTNTLGFSTSAVVAVTFVFANTNAILSDIGTTTPIPGVNDISQLNNNGAAQSPDGLNYYFDNGSPPGQTFTTGNNPSILSSLAIDLAGNSGRFPAGGEGYILRIYKVSGSTATLYAVYASQTNFVITTGVNDADWLRWSGLAVPLAANTTYAYTFASTGGGYGNLANVGGNPYSGGEVALIPPGGGAITFGSSDSYDGTFVLGFALPGYPIVSPPVFSPSNTVYAGTPVTVTANVSGSGPFTYQWQSDGGTGNFANISGATSPTLSINTTALAGETVNYTLTATNASGSTTSEATALIVNSASTPILSTDITNSLYQIPPVTTFVGGSVAFSVGSFQGTLPITYQWQTDGGTGTFTNIPNQTNLTLNLANLKVSNSGNYKLVASNSQGPTPSSIINLAVLPQPTNTFVVNFQWYSTYPNDVGTYSGPGAAGIGTGTYWNQVVGPNATNNTPGAYYTSSSGYSDDGTTNRGISWTIFSNNSWDYTNSPPIPLLDAAANAYGTNSFVFTLPSGVYNLVLFSCGGNQAATNNQGTLFTINGVTQMSQSLMPTTDTSIILNNNYVVFTNVWVTGTSLTGTWSDTQTNGSNNYGSLNGAQLQYLGPLVTLTAHAAAGGKIELDWSSGTLLQTTNLTGPWTTNSSATSPYLVTPTAPQEFFKVQ